MQVDLFGEPMLSNPIQPSSEADAPVDLFGVAINQPTCGFHGHLATHSMSI
ncbi:hypothetical protein [Pseudomonas aeruginosa]|uniref:hypothetical protein n=1 Tax=Pseudomonas aeruginosa TaxID=287 RepID=UPI0027D95B71|nr:hypothetical protein [Pseudomonas aeruginosa]WME50731.1 hypothetical protein RBH03_32595 [Pseudomonas aeruginosa]